MVLYVNHIDISFFYILFYHLFIHFNFNFFLIL